MLYDYWYNVGGILGERSIVPCLCLPYQYNGLRGCALQLFTHLGVTTFTECISASLCYCVVLLLIKCCIQSALVDKTVHNKGQNSNKKCIIFNYVFSALCKAASDGAIE